jgi:hypothetical protein
MSVVDLDRFKSKRGRAAPTPKPDAQRVWSQGAQRWVEVAKVPTDETQQVRRKPFQAQWVRFPLSWRAALRQTRSINAVHLAIEILFAEFRRQHTGGEIVLSEAVTGLPHPPRGRAVRTLVKLGLIEVEQYGRQAPRVTKVQVGDAG